MAQAITIGVDASEAIADGQLGTPRVADVP
jgi:hypothetical protein